ncbi:MAG: radical SAM protein [Chloroflexi bacterium]|nr:MAG: radical SAM protein [Chloroflexota bacterium]
MQTLEQTTALHDLAEPGRVLLISCYELGRQPLNLAFPLAFLREAGYQPAVVDTSVETLDDDALRSARFIAISVPMHTALRLGIEIAARARRVNPQARICFYGLYAWLNADYLLREHADYAIGGEVEQALLALVQALQRGDDDPPPGVSTSQRLSPPQVTRIAFPIPDRAGLPNHRAYARLMRDGIAVPAGYTETTRGCVHTCLHCPVVPVYKGRFFAIPRAVVLEDIRRQVRAGIGHITFGDPDFLNGPTHALRICRELHERYPTITFDFTTRIEHILEHRDLLPEFKELGCVFILSAVETVSEHILQALDKGHTPQDVIDALAACDAAGITLRPSLLPFTPWTTLDDYLDLLTFFETWDLAGAVDPVHFSIRLLVPPGSALLERPESATWLGELDEAGFTWTWRNPDPRVDELQRAVAALVEMAERDGSSPVETFARIKALAWGVKGVTPPAVTPLRRAIPGESPRLSESWFC